MAWGLLLLGYCSLIVFLSHRPMLPVPDYFSWQDKPIHAVAYALMAWLCWRTIRALRVFSDANDAVSPAVMCILFCVLFGISDEWHQSFVAGREASVADWLADLFGASLLTLTLWKREVKEFKRSKT